MTEVNPYSAPRAASEAGDPVQIEPREGSWLRWSWGVPLCGYATAITSGAVWLVVPRWDYLEIVSMLALYGGILSGFIFTIAGSVWFLFRRRRGIHVLLGWLLSAVVPLSLLGGLIAFEYWWRQ